MAKDEEKPWRAEPLQIIPRDGWGADPPKASTPMVHPVHKVVYTFNTDIPVCTTKEDCISATQVLQGRHMRLEGRDDIKYNFLVGGDGLVYEGRGYFSQPCNSLEFPEHNGDRLDIAFLGDYKAYDDVPSKLKIAAYDVAQKGINDGYVVEFYEAYEVEPPPPPPDIPSLDEFLDKHLRDQGLMYNKETQELVKM